MIFFFEINLNPQIARVEQFKSSNLRNNLVFQPKKLHKLIRFSCPILFQ